MDSCGSHPRSLVEELDGDEFAIAQWQVHYRTALGERLQVTAPDGVLASPALAGAVVLSAGIHAADGVGGLLLLDADGGFNFIAPQRSGRSCFDLLCRVGQAFVTGRLLIDVLPTASADRPLSSR